MYIIQTTDVTWVAVFSPEACEICKILMEIFNKNWNLYIPNNNFMENQIFML
jgi:hypothetical protein